MSYSPVKIFKALNDENRVKILEYIQRGVSSDSCGVDAMCVTDLAEVSHISAATASHHIKELMNAGLITTTKKGRWVYCHVNQEALEEASVFLKKLQEGKL